MRKDAEKQIANNLAAPPEQISAVLLDLSVQAIEAAAGNAGTAKLGLAKMIREERDLELERVLYSPYHNAAIDSAISAGYRDLGWL